MPIARSADAMMLTASPSAAPGARLKLSVTEGNCSWCAIASGAVVRIISAKAVERHLRARRARHEGRERLRVLRARGRKRLARDVRRHVDLRQRRRIALILRRGLEDHAVLVRLPVDGGDLPLAERIVERVVDHLHRDAEPAGLLAVDVDEGAQAAFLRLGRHVAQRRVRRAAPRPAGPTTRRPRRRRCATSVYWYCARLGRVEIWMSCTGWK